jgi:hypothetical protein
MPVVFNKSHLLQRTEKLQVSPYADLQWERIFKSLGEKRKWSKRGVMFQADTGAQHYLSIPESLRSHRGKVALPRNSNALSPRKRADCLPLDRLRLARGNVGRPFAIAGGDQLCAEQASRWNARDPKAAKAQGKMELKAYK